ncbi:MAG: twin-arginine translocase TatA/TatE family subunit, partial [Chloroflexi bacterium]|nr:twin-arginine translocase TatA/TatE family subunit [Chloroflexota bacterium]
MFGIGYQEMFFVLVVALVIFGPCRLTVLAGQVGGWVRDFRRMSAEFTVEFVKTFAEVDEVKKSFTREMQSIQSEVEGVGKSARGDLKKSATKSVGAGKKSATGAAKSGTASSASSSNPTSSKTAAGVKAVSANGRATKTGRAGRLTGIGTGPLPVATKADPLADVSFFDLDVTVGGGKNGSSAGVSAAVPGADDPLSRVRRRRVTAGYARQATG